MWRRSIPGKRQLNPGIRNDNNNGYTVSLTVTLYACVHIPYWQKSQIPLGHRIHYSLAGVVIYERLSKHLAHYSAFVKDRSKWFYINDSHYNYMYVDKSLVHNPVLKFNTLL